MTLRSGIPVLAQLVVDQISARLRLWSLPFKFATGASILLLGSMVYLGTLVSDYIRDSAIQQSAGVPALRIESLVGPHIQELALQDTLSTENLDELAKLLSPGEMQRPVVAFRVWKGDKIVFSNERQLIGKTFAISRSRERAWQGQIAVEFDHPDGDDDEQVRSLKVPILEVYAPLRKDGTDRIIAIVETYEIAIDLQKNLLAAQLAFWLAIAAVTLGSILLLFSVARTGSIERQLLLTRVVESEWRSRRIGLANLKVTEMSERSLTQIETALHHGPAQHVTFALLKLGSLTDLAAKFGAFASSDANEFQNDMEAIRQALNNTLLQIRNFASRRLPSNIAELSLGEIVASVCRRHELRSGLPVEVENDGLPDQSPLSLKVCLYRIALEGLNCVSDDVQQQARTVRLSSVDDLIRLEIVGSGLPDRPEITSLRNRVEAAGGTLHVDSSADGRLLLSTILMISDMELANA